MGAGALFALGHPVWGGLLVILCGVLDALDGKIAKLTGKASSRGDFLDHVLDRYADIFIITGIFAGGAAPWIIGVFGLTGVLMSSYLGTQAQPSGLAGTMEEFLAGLTVSCS
jgi:archaetidylinositol phosphate synthase